jgi:hypothetical protein
MSGGALAGPGWYADPIGTHSYRWWDGLVWTGRVADGAVESFDPIDGVLQARATATAAREAGGLLPPEAGAGPLPPPPAPTPAYPRSSVNTRSLVITLVALGAVFGVLLLGIAVAIIFGIGEPHYWNLVYNFNSGKSDFSVIDPSTASLDYVDKRLLLTVNTADQPVGAFVTFSERQQTVSVYADLDLHSGSATATRYGPACWAGDQYYAFLIADTGDYQFVAGTGAGLPIVLASGSDQALAGPRTHPRVEIYCGDDGGLMAGIDDDIGFMPLAQAPNPSGPYTGGGVIVETSGPPVQILIDTFVAESHTDPAP